jgi:hypothetical protein
VRCNTRGPSFCSAPGWPSTVARDFCKPILREDDRASRLTSARCNAAWHFTHKGGESHPYVHLQSDWRVVHWRLIGWVNPRSQFWRVRMLTPNLVQNCRWVSPFVERYRRRTWESFSGEFPRGCGSTLTARIKRWQKGRTTLPFRQLMECISYALSLAGRTIPLRTTQKR